MMEVQKFLRGGGSLADLNKDLGIGLTCHPREPLVILDYHQLNSPRKHPIVRECRGLVLEMNSWNVVARPMYRFFNLGEDPEADKAFDWNNFDCYSKEDGSLILFYYYNGYWHVNTRATYADRTIQQGVLNITWEELFYSALVHEHGIECLSPAYTYVFELCSPYNKVVRRYEKPTLFLLTSIENSTGIETTPSGTDVLATFLGVERPQRWHFENLDDLQICLSQETDPTFEGFVCRDKNGTRVKIKNKDYVALHHLAGEGHNKFHPKYLLPLVLNERDDAAQEMLTYYPEVADNYWSVHGVIEKAKVILRETHLQAERIESRKEWFAFITEKAGSLYPILAHARDYNVEDPVKLLPKFEEHLLKVLFKKLPANSRYKTGDLQWLPSGLKPSDTARPTTTDPPRLGRGSLTSPA